MSTVLSFGDVLLVPFPFTDQQGSKQRPAVIVSSNAYNTNRPAVLIMAITSVMRSPALRWHMEKQCSPIGKARD